MFFISLKSFFLLLDKTAIGLRGGAFLFSYFKDIWDKSNMEIKRNDSL